MIPEQDEVDRAWRYLRQLVDSLPPATESWSGAVPDALRAVAISVVDLERRLKAVEDQPRRTLIEVVQHFNGADPDRVAKALVEALERSRGPTTA